MSDDGGQYVNSAHVHRVSQADALRLDTDLESTLLSTAKEAFRHFPSSFFDTFSPELLLFLRAFVFRHTLFHALPSPGERFFRLRPVTTLVTPRRPFFGLLVTPPSSLQRALHFLLAAVLPYIATRLRRHAARADWGGLPSENLRARVWRSLGLLEALAKVLGLCTRLQFLYRGTHASLAGRLSGVTATPASYAALRAPPVASDAPELLGTRLLTAGMAEFMLFAAPLASALKPSGRESRNIHNHGNPNACGACGTSAPTMPHVALPCLHAFCYLCIAMPRERDPAHVCVVCRRRIDSLRRVDAAG